MDLRVCLYQSFAAVAIVEGKNVIQFIFDLFLHRLTDHDRGNLFLTAGGTGITAAATATAGAVHVIHRMIQVLVVVVVIVVMMMMVKQVFSRRSADTFIAAVVVH